MGMDGLSRPNQLLPFGNLNASERAAETNRNSALVSRNDAVNPTGDYHESDAGGGNQQHRKRRDSWEEELEAILKAQFNLNLDSSLVYEFIFNEKTERMELIDALSGNVLLSLTPEEFIQVTQNMNRNAGIITDRTA